APVGPPISGLAPDAIAGQPRSWAGVGASNDASNQRPTSPLDGARGVDSAVVDATVLNPSMLRIGRTPGSGEHGRQRRACPLPGKLAGDLGQAGGVAVALGEDRVVDRPLDAHPGAAPPDSRLGAGVVVARELVGDVGRLAENAKAVREPHRDEQLTVRLVVEVVALPRAVRRRVAAQADRDVPDPAAHAQTRL